MSIDNISLIATLTQSLQVIFYHPVTEPKQAP